MENDMELESYREAVRLYRRLVKFGGRDELIRNVSQPHNTQFLANTDQSANYYKNLYVDQVSVQDSCRLLPPPDDGTCAGCKKHFLTKRPIIDHQTDLDIGNYLENHFMNFMNENFKSRSLPLNCLRADTQRLNMPDFKIIRTDIDHDVLFFEFKCIFKPFIKISDKIAGTYCYNNSMTLDCDIKLERQKKLINSSNIESKTIYIYWYDIPCVKGVFWQYSDFIYQHQTKTLSYTRAMQPGDYKDNRQVGHIDKIYLPLHMMKNFNELFESIIKTIY
ncbi:hypothetical protein [Shewanella septentrionalis]|uniref:Uncharacterized protein n=1 Tax=Shewanella septentrionalis TaxID=2952223 RepID=A0A9X2WXJ4_9GAMM|nr:hypothetical protein [Shewanella septentrionalis]MCT7947271.1 hypothetical protein [Shewanella septentrionalis]